MTMHESLLQLTANIPTIDERRHLTAFLDTSATHFLIYKAKPRKKSRRRRRVMHSRLSWSAYLFLLVGSKGQIPTTDESRWRGPWR